MSKDRIETEHSKVARESRLVSAAPIYYGWIILAIGTVGVILTSPGQTYAISVFIDHFISDLSISRSMVSTLYTVGTLTASFALPFVGRQLDQRGSRFMIVAVSLLLGLACVYMGVIRNATMLGLGFFALRMLGQGSLGLVCRNVINQWWVRRRGLVMGIGGMVGALIGSGGFPNLINWLIPILGWRSTYMLLGVLVLLVMLPLGSLFIRNRPEDYGLPPDGSNNFLNADDAQQHTSIEEHWTLSEVLRTPTFWLIISGFASMSMLSTGLTFHFFSVFKDSGLSSTVAAAVFVPIAVTSAVMQFGGGLLIDKMPIRVMLSVSLLLQTVILMMAPNLPSVTVAFTFGITVGMRNGFQHIVSNVVWARYFGRRHLGSITGIVSLLQVGSSALGSMPFGIARDLMGSYRTVLNGFAILPFVLAFITLFFAKPPERKKKES